MIDKMIFYFVACFLYYTVGRYSSCFRGAKISCLVVTTYRYVSNKKRNTKKSLTQDLTFARSRSSPDVIVGPVSSYLTPTLLSGQQEGGEGKKSLFHINTAGIRSTLRVILCHSLPPAQTHLIGYTGVPQVGIIALIARVVRSSIMTRQETYWLFARNTPNFCLCTHVRTQYH